MPLLRATPRPRESLQKCRRPSVVQKVFSKNSNPPAFEWRDWAGEHEPNQYFSGDLTQVRLDLHAKGLCPIVQLSGVGLGKALRLKT